MLFFHESISIIQFKKLTFAPMAPHNLGVIEMALMVFLFTFSMNLKKDTMLAEYVHSLEMLIKQFLSDVLTHVDLFYFHSVCL